MFGILERDNFSCCNHHCSYHRGKRSKGPQKGRRGQKDHPGTVGDTCAGIPPVDGTDAVYVRAVPWQNRLKTL